MIMARVFNELHKGYDQTSETRATFTTFDEFSHISVIGEGHYGRTFRGRWHNDKKDYDKWMNVALKVSKKKPGENEFSEAMMLANLVEHENTISIYGVCNNFHHKSIGDQPTVAIMMPYFEHGDLMSYLKNLDDLNLFEIINITVGMARGIQHLHDNEIIHRDIRPENFLVSDHRRIIVSDFGLSRSVAENYIYENSGPQVPWRWCAPETIIKLEHTKNSDIWMLGVSLWQLVHNEPVFADFKSPAQLGIAFNDGLKLKISDGCPPMIAEIVRKCTEYEPKNRIQLNEIICILVKEGKDLEYKSCIVRTSKPDNFGPPDENKSGDMSEEKKYDQKFVDQKPVDQKPGDQKSVAQKSVDKKPGDTLAEGKPGYELLAPGLKQEREDNNDIVKSDEEMVRAATSTGRVGGYDHFLNLLMIGDSGVGKSCLVRRFADSDFTSSSILTTGIDFNIKALSVGSKTVKVQTWDTAGQERFRGVTVAYYSSAQAILLCYDVTDRQSFQNVTVWADDIKSHTGSRLRMFVLVACKCDIPDRVVTKQEGENMASEIGADYFCETSAMTCYGVVFVYAQIVAFFVKSFEVWPDESAGTIRLEAGKGGGKSCCSRQ